MIPSGGATFPFPTNTQDNPAPGNGGPAFPTPDVYFPDGSVEHGKNGMTLRDYFAAAALTGIIINNLDGPVEKDAASAYAYADAMLKEREQRR